MERKKNLWSRMAVILLIGCLMTVLLWGCSDGNALTPTRTEETETTAPPEPELLDTKDKAMAYVEEMVHNGAKEISLVCSQEIYDVLMRVTYKGDGWERKAYHSLLNQAGVYNCRVSTAGMKRTITITSISLYPGYEIFRSVEAGTEDKLTSELKKTLAEARSMAEACKTSDPLETAKNIQSELCTKVRYAYMTNMSNVDTAIGPLLKGVADCDGYADAFYLVGRLAGLEVRHQQGISSYYDFEKNTIVTGSHMWNLLKLDGSWRVVDVCWADGENGIDYTWFNIGKDRASRSRTWLEDLSVPLLETTDLSTRPETEYSVTSYEDMEAAIQAVFEREQYSFTIIYDGENYRSKQDAFDLLWNYYDGEISYSWDESTRVLNIILGDYADSQ